jgi:hypothetical protein
MLANFDRDLDCSSLFRRTDYARNISLSDGGRTARHLSDKSISRIERATISSNQFIAPGRKGQQLLPA